jgi:RNA polymerase sigma-70 factor (ECF subfamily)
MIASGGAGIVLNTPAPATGHETVAADEVLSLFEAHGQSLYRFARVVLRDPHEAEDVVQTAFVRLIDHLGRGGGRSNLKAWLFAVAANLCRDHVRRRKRWLVWLPEHERLMTAPGNLETRDPDDLFLATLRTLAPRDRVLLALKAQGLSYRQIATAAGVRETSVGRLLARAMARWQRARVAMSHT